MCESVIFSAFCARAHIEHRRARSSTVTLSIILLRALIERRRARSSTIPHAHICEILSKLECFDHIWRTNAFFCPNCCFSSNLHASVAHQQNLHFRWPLARSRTLFTCLNNFAATGGMVFGTCLCRCRGFYAEQCLRLSNPYAYVQGESLVNFVLTIRGIFHDPHYQ